jgi:hypothetical protein
LILEKLEEWAWALGKIVPKTEIREWPEALA